MKDIVERFVQSHGITMIVVIEDLGFDPWEKIENTPVMKLICFSKTPGKGQLIYCSNHCNFSESFTVLENRSFHWGDNHIISNLDENEENENNG